MKKLFVVVFGLFALNSFAQTKQAIDTDKKIMTVDAACGQCKFGLKGKGCSLAVRMDGKAYFVDGTDIDSHGDAHADDGFCKKIRKAKVQGEVVQGRFKASYFELLPEAINKKQKQSAP